VISFSPTDESTRYSTYSIRNKPEPASSPPGTPVPHIEHSEIDPLAANFFAFKILPLEFNIQDTSALPDDEEAQETDRGETCRAVSARVVDRIREQCGRLGVTVPVEDKDVVR